MEFEWDDEKEALVRAERGHGFRVPARIFLGRTVERIDDREDYGELRIIAVGKVGRRFWTVVYTDRGSVRRIVTPWPSSQRERELWQG